MDILSPFSSLSKCWHGIPRYTKIQFFSTLIIGLLVHLYMMTNCFVNHDSSMVNSYDKGWYDYLGRWFGTAVDMVTTSYVLIWANRMLGLVYISIAACLIGNCLKIRKTPLVLIFSALIVSFPTVACAFSYANTADGFFVVVVMVSLAFFIARRYKYGFLIGIIPMTLGMASYQAYLGFFSGLMIASLIRDLLVGHEEAKAVFIKGLKYLVTFVGGLVCYVLSLNAITVPLNGYAGINELGGTTISNFFPRFVDSYSNLFAFFFKDTYKMHQTWMWFVNYKYLFAVAALCAVFLVIYVVIKRKIYSKKASLILLLAMLALFVPAVNIVAIASPGHLYIAMQYSIILIFAMIMSIIEIAAETVEGISFNWQIRAVGLSVWALIVIFCLTTITYTLYTNKFYAKLDIVHQQGYAYSVSLMNRIQSDVDYIREKYIFLYGSPAPIYSVQQFKDMEGIYIEPFIPHWYTYSYYLYNHIGLENIILDQLALQWYEYTDLESPEFKEMMSKKPSYPAVGSIFEFKANGTNFIIVKFSD